MSVSPALRVSTAVAVAAALVLPSPTASALDGSRQADFTSAAKEFGVPENVLLGVSFLESRWDVNAGAPSRGAGYGPMHLTDAAALDVDEHDHHGSEAEDPRGDLSRPLAPVDSAPQQGVPAELRTIEAAERLTGVDRAVLRSNARQNIRGGAALLASHQRELGSWYGAVAKYSGAKDTATAKRFADDVFEVIRTGEARTTDDGQAVRLVGQDLKPDTGIVDRMGLRPSAPNEAECPRELGCEWLPAAYEHHTPSNPEKYGNHDKANRPVDMPIKYIIIHDTEGYWDTTLRLIKDPKWASWQYSLRSSDGHIAQHIKAKDVAWQAGNWYVNTHSIGLEHEGFAAKGTWYTEAMYRTSARLVRYLAQKHGVPLDRAHILGHDNVPGVSPAKVRGMHWDPGPYWDWAHYFDLLKAPFTPRGGDRSGIVTIKPDYATNHPPMYGCDDKKPAEPCPTRGTSTVFLHTEPRADAPLVKDIGLRPDGGNSTRQVSDIGARVDTGQRFAVAGRSGDWTAIWYLGQKAWFHNPSGTPTAVPGTGFVVTPRPGLASVPVFGIAYPEASAYEGTGVPVQTVEPLQYTMLPGQRYVAADLAVPSEYYFAKEWNGPRIVVRGHERYYQVFLGHRIAYVKAADVHVLPGPIGAPR
ncbi:peptidoglycan recognition family protein [Allokutzneria sp. NRRL B-24872]|uniref:peptidoglycan recognition protein family protein n=1 Tax=Allokutzneria sp. NRRL B-24872 TaxID=1137961 RepID=UPI000A3BA0DC|nr:peptidoglycan recognition family protein [Allokutzneria sp. NRRL B-24872]